MTGAKRAAVLAGFAYAVVLAGLLTMLAGGIALTAGTGLWGMKRLLFICGFVVLGLAALQWRPAPAWTGSTGSGAPDAPWLARRVCGLLGQPPGRVPVAPARAGAAVLVLAWSFLLEAVGGV